MTVLPRPMKRYKVRVLNQFLVKTVLQDIILMNLNILFDDLFILFIFCHLSVW